MNPTISINDIKSAADRVRENVGRVIVGKGDVVDLAIVALLCEGHILLEDVPGIGKTTLAKALARSLDCTFRRIQFTPDLLPSDVTGLAVYNQKTQDFEYRAGPLMSQIVLADEINRATPKTQSALLEAMQEHQVTAGGELRRLEEPFFVMATQNPIDQEGTYPLPEAQLDRFFFKILVGYPSADELTEVLNRTTAGAQTQVQKVLNRESLVELMALVRQVPVASHVKDYAVRLVLATHPRTDTAAPIATQYLRFGSSPRGGQTLILAGKVRALTHGRFNVSFDDLEAVAATALRHRLIPNFEAEAEGITTDHIVAQVLKDVIGQLEMRGRR